MGPDFIDQAANEGIIADIGGELGQGDRARHAPPSEEVVWPKQEAMARLLPSILTCAPTSIAMSIPRQPW